MCESEADELSGEDSESSSEPEMDFSHKNKKSGVSASDKITPSRSATTFVSIFVISDKAAATSLDCLWSDGNGLDDLALQKLASVTLFSLVGRVTLAPKHSFLEA